MIKYILLLLALATSSYAQGIASRYPGDKNIGLDPAVILADDFESYNTPSNAVGKWSSISNVGNMRIATETGNYFAGFKSLEMQLPVSTAEKVDSLWKHLSTKQKVLYVRAYIKFDSGFDVETSSHNGLRISGGKTLTGVKPPANGTGFFITSLQNNATSQPLIGEFQPGYHQIYAYWPKQRDNYGDHWFSDGWVRPGGAGLWLLSPSKYPNFQPMPKHQPIRGQWYCYELMTKLNTIGKNDGEVAWWIDGQLDGHITNLFFRSINSLLIDTMALRFHALHSERLNKKWYDNVVIAKSYIGPMAP